MKFNPQKELEGLIKFIQEYYTKNNLKKAIIGISGGKDSAVAAAILTKALGSENVLGVTLPCHSKKEDATDALVIGKFYNFKIINFDLSNIFDEFKKELKVLNKESNDNADINLKPRLRMTTLYYLGSIFSTLENAPYLVVGTSNKCELYVGYFTKGGDSVHDIAILSDFTVDEVIQIGELLKVPEKILYKKPHDGLSKETDEEKLGVSYKNITNYLNGIEIEGNSKRKIEQLHTSNKHKFSIPTYRKGMYEENNI